MLELIHQFGLVDLNAAAPTEEEVRRYRQVLDGTAELSVYADALLDLSSYLHRVHGEKVVILIDEYDAPIHAGVAGGHVREVLDFFRLLLTQGLKGNPHLFKAVLTGILRVAQESIRAERDRGGRVQAMRWSMIAMLLVSCTGEAPPRAPESRAPVAPAPGPAPAPTPAPAPVSTATTVAAVDPREATRRTAHDVLAEHCGECHEGHRSKAPKALAVFDLDQPDWPTRFDEHRYQAALRRLASKPPAARDAFIAFRDAELAALSAKSSAKID